MLSKVEKIYGIICCEIFYNQSSGIVKQIAIG